VIISLPGANFLLNANKFSSVFDFKLGYMLDRYIEAEEVCPPIKMAKRYSYAPFMYFIKL